MSNRDSGIIDIDSFPTVRSGLTDIDASFTSILSGGVLGFRIVSATIRANGTTLDLVFSEAATQGSGFNVSDLTGTTSGTGAKTFTYTSGDGTDAWVLEANAEMGALESGPITWAGTADGIENAEGEDLGAKTRPIINNSGVFFSNENFEYELDFNFVA